MSSARSGSASPTLEGEGSTDAAKVHRAQFHRAPRPEMLICYWVSDGMFDMLIDAILSQVKRAGFCAVFADGHGPSRWAWCARLQDRQDRFGLTLIGVTCDRYDKWQNQMDHAAANETSLTMATTPALVDLAELGADRSVGPQGVAGDDPRDAAADHGRQCLEASVKLVGQWLEDAGV